MAFSYIQFNGDGTTRNFSIPFTFINKNHIKVTVDDSPVSFSWLSSNAVQLAVAPANGTVVAIRRVSSQGSRLTDFVDGSTLTEADLDLSANHPFMMAQEALDKAEENLGIADVMAAKRIQDYDVINADRVVQQISDYTADLREGIVSLTDQIGKIGSTESLFDQFNIPVAMYNGTGEPVDGLAKRLLRSSQFGSHAGQAISHFHVEANPVGSGKNGPAHADFGLSIRANKQNWTHTTTPGEIDGINIVNRQGGAEATSFDTSSDGCSILGNYQSIGNTGYHGVFEFAVSKINRGDYSVDRSIGLQGGIIDDFGGNPHDHDNPLRWVPNPRSFGYMANFIGGENDIGLLIQETTGTWKEFAHFTSYGSKFIFKRDGRLQLGEGSTRMTIQNFGGHIRMSNATEEATVFEVYQNGFAQSPYYRLIPSTAPTLQQGAMYVGGDGNFYYCGDGATWRRLNWTQA